MFTFASLLFCKLLTDDFLKKPEAISSDSSMGACYKRFVGISDFPFFACLLEEVLPDFEATPFLLLSAIYSARFSNLTLVLIFRFIGPVLLFISRFSYL